jgi:hypothetical protein
MINSFGKSTFRHLLIYDDKLLFFRNSDDMSENLLNGGRKVFFVYYK